MQVKFAKGGFTNTMSGNMNARSNQISKKLLDLDDFDVQMLSPDFLSTKTLKKPFNQLDIHLKKTNPNGTRFHLEEKDKPISSSSIEYPQHSLSKTSQKFHNKKTTEEKQYKYVSCGDLNIQPAYQSKPKLISQYGQSTIPLQLKDKNSIISALFKKGEMKASIPIEIKVTKAASQEKVGAAQAKLKTLFNKNNITKVPIENSKKPKQSKHDSQIDEQIHQSIEQDYENESFQKISAHQQSLIKQSIRQSIAASSAIKQSIRQSMPEEIPEASMRSAKSKIKSEIKEDIIESMQKSKQSIEEEVYEQIFDEASLSDDLKKSKTSHLKNSKGEEKFELSVSASKGFRTKTNPIVKSIKFAEEINQIKVIDNKIHDKVEKGDKLAAEIMKEKGNVTRLQQKIATILQSHTMKNKKPQTNKNLDLLHNFKIEINRLITSENFMSKIRKLTAFLGPNASSQGSSEEISNLEDKLLANLMERIQDLRVSGATQSQVAALKKEYDQKLSILLKDQQVKLRVEMDRKLHEKDLQLKKMIAELEQKFQRSAPISYLQSEIQKKQFYGDRVEVDSDYSIDSDEISWKMDLWEILPDFEKKKMYQKQGNAVAKFLTDILVKQVKNENLDRSADISFEFPQMQNDSIQYPNISSKTRNYMNEEDDFGMAKPTINREQLRKQIKKTAPEKQEIFPPLPGVKKQASQESSHFVSNIGYLQVPPVNGQGENEVRDTLSVSEVVKILAKYKNIFLKKKNDLVRKLVKTLQAKTKESEPLSSLLNELRILNPRQVQAADDPFVKAYEQELIMELISIYNGLKNRKNSVIQEQMKRMYDRLVVTCQVKTAEASVGLPSQIAPQETYINLRMNQQDNKIKDQVVKQICNILALEFAKQMPKRR